MANLKELNALALRVYNNEMKVETNEKGETIYNDAEDIQTLVDKTFNSGSPSQEKLSQFNEVLIRTAEIIAEPRLEQMINLFAKYTTVTDGTIKVIKLPKTNEKARIIWTANGVGVDYVRLSQDVTQKPAVPQIMSTGAYYEVSDFSGNAVDAFRNVVDTVVDAMIQFYFEKVSQIIAQAVVSGDIPASHCVNGSNLKLSEYRPLEDLMIRKFKGRPTFVGDSALIGQLANSQINAEVKDLLTDDLRKSLREDLVITKLGRSLAVNLVNPYTDEDDTKTAFPINEAYVFPAGVNAKPIEITKYGKVVQYTDFDSETERVGMKIKFKLSIDLIDAKKIGVVKDDALNLA